MLNNVKREVGGSTYVLRLNTRAMMAVEATFDKSIIEVLETLEGSPRVGIIVGLIRECMKDGQGVDLSVAQSFVDAIGFAGAAELLGEVATAAFPEATNEKN